MSRKSAESFYRARYKVYDGQHNENTYIDCINLSSFLFQVSILIVFGKYDIKIY